MSTVESHTPAEFGTKSKRVLTMALDWCRLKAFVLVGYAAARHEVSGVEVKKH